ncbi:MULTISPECIES: aminotransferase class I/II-fold pyridoxal phosphate-dependent enzyme [unclassified Sporosarcina]|uniref:aminotransferase class I/II-fold pyridoxal phosphate-dependent enzyme n=1 Tax=unclassified Sporosarcina TaxID=2647733 RepID=UPI000C16B25F|nr:MULTISPECIES: aminotransferase class I/II-fold pyridoxal phosphate-dependent enzyme [unclassified Sporosarcina]PIC98920.1 LL-diaminopimelate aminotransferase [Sporosarcina sp. P29]PID04814.1 LL-diaminopimelate aminotransferase [Sporosarcina sp. P30]PID07969.1 LL-diaminopimelate aminotransferase [Sporosarcina sp. P31]PID11155.1 LL-diaminopimelate aminotransferase [Sporosarcina sp. P32b]
MNFQPSQKMSIFSPAIFGDLKAAAELKKATGAQVVDLSLGSPDLPPDERVRQALSEQSALASSYGYTLGGTKRFHEAVANYYKRRTGVIINPDTEVLQTMGSQEGLVHLPFAFCDEGDYVLTTNPAYVAYDAGIKLAGAVPYYMPLLAENGFLPNLNEIPEDVLKKTKLLILNLPGNPVPAMPSETFFEEVVAFAKKYEIIVLHDAAYSEYYFTGDRPASFLTTPGAMEVGLEINSLSKSFSLAGARIAYFVGNAEMIKVIRELKSNLDYGTFGPIQEAAIVALDNGEEITDRLRAEFSKRHHALMNGLASLGWETTPSEGGMFVWAKYPYDIDDIEFVFEVIKQAGVVMVPGSIFGTAGIGYVRLALVQKVELIEKAIEQLRELSLVRV